jgi:hypothetical protein
MHSNRPWKLPRQSYIQLIVVAGLITAYLTLCDCLRSNQWPDRFSGHAIGNNRPYLAIMPMTGAPMLVLANERLGGISSRWLLSKPRGVGKLVAPRTYRTIRA